MIRDERMRARLVVAGGAALMAAALVALSVPDSRRMPVETVSAERSFSQEVSRSSRGRTVLEAPRVDYQSAVEAEAVAQYLHAVDDENKRIAAENAAAAKKQADEARRIAKEKAAEKAAAKAAAQAVQPPPPADTTDTVAEQPLGDNCGPGKKSWDQAHACYWPLIAQYPWPHARAFAILMCESTGDPSARNGSHWGLMQLDTGPFWDPATNIAIAYKNYYAPHGNFSKWAC